MPQIVYEEMAGGTTGHLIEEISSVKMGVTDFRW